MIVKLLKDFTLSGVVMQDQFDKVCHYCLRYIHHNSKKCTRKFGDNSVISY